MNAGHSTRRHMKYSDVESDVCTDSCDDEVEVVNSRSNALDGKQTPCRIGSKGSPPFPCTWRSSVGLEEFCLPVPTGAGSHQEQDANKFLYSPKSLYLATPLVFNSPDGGVPLGRSP